MNEKEIKKELEYLLSKINCSIAEVNMHFDCNSKILTINGETENLSCLGGTGNGLVDVVMDWSNSIMVFSFDTGPNILVDLSNFVTQSQIPNLVYSNQSLTTLTLSSDGTRLIYLDEDGINHNLDLLSSVLLPGFPCLYTGGSGHAFTILLLQGSSFDSKDVSISGMTTGTGFVPFSRAFIIGRYVNGRFISDRPELEAALLEMDAMKPAGYALSESVIRFDTQTDTLYVGYDNIPDTTSLIGGDTIFPITYMNSAYVDYEFLAGVKKTFVWDGTEYLENGVPRGSLQTLLRLEPALTVCPSPLTSLSMIANSNTLVYVDEVGQRNLIPLEDGNKSFCIEEYTAYEKWEHTGQGNSKHVVSIDQNGYTLQFLLIHIRNLQNVAVIEFKKNGITFETVNISNLGFNQSVSHTIPNGVFLEYGDVISCTTNTCLNTGLVVSYDLIKI